ncbi:MAG TPA: hypothetical protein DET40_24750 [Lentisphaeria bacterium]|nr:MAG: hypothetical protein A2X45_01255 [Lentisphaerae bacterium GWF2_50_93]HCE46770.1 hypothetical protein [Lentisphaeria bacterium]
MKSFIDIILEDKDIKSFVEERESLYFENELGYKYIDDNEGKNEKILRMEYLLLNELLGTQTQSPDRCILLDKAYSILKSYDISEEHSSRSFSKIMGIDGLRNQNLYCFYLASIALCSDKTVRIRLDLKDYGPHEPRETGSDWNLRVLNGIFEAFILLVRKQDGFKDIANAIRIISQLKEEQKAYEESYLDKIPDERSKTENALSLLGLYHLSKTITETAEYLVQGYNYAGSLESEIRIHSELARKIFRSQPRLQSITDILEANLGRLQRNSIWYSTSAIQSKKLKEFCTFKSKAEKSLVELLPSQRNALNENLLNIASNVTVVEMPTSSGKTLLAEFNIIVTKALDADSKIIYIVPSRALVNQVYSDLKTDFEDIGFSVEKTSGAIELDPSEDIMLHEKIDILVSTPEKIDLLIRRDHPSVKDVSLFVVDEAHMIQNGERGAKLELLLSILKRERPNSKFMFLSPFLRDSANIIADWIGGNKIKTSIKIDWRPSEKILIGLSGLKKFKEFSYTLLPSAYSLIPEEKILEPPFAVDKPLSGKPRQRYIEFAARNFGMDGKSVLYLCQGPGKVDNNAKFLGGVLESEIESENIRLVKNFITDEVGRETVLSSVLDKRIALHHAGLSDETKMLVEYLIRAKEIKYVFATSTVAEGVNFPVSAVYFDSYRKGDNNLTSNDFWNIAGRAGRTMVDNYGKLIFPFDSKDNIHRAKSLIGKSSENIASVLLKFIDDADQIINTIENSPKNAVSSLSEKYRESLAPLIQYLIHLLNTSGNGSYIEIEDLFKDSLGYYQIQSKDQKDKFIEICRRIYLLLQKNFQKGWLVYADKTGFSVPSVLEIMRSENRKNPSIASPESWEPQNLFNPDSGFLSEKIKVIARLRETQLGTDSRKNEFNPEAVARVLIGWVKGEQLFDISSSHPAFANKDDADRINDFVKYINSARFKASWGLGALEGIINASESDIKENSYIPSFVYFGVDTKEALLMRMAGIPRRLAKPMSQIISNEKSISLSQIRKRINGLTGNDWDSIAPKDSKLSGQEWKRISEIMVK